MDRIEELRKIIRKVLSDHYDISEDNLISKKKGKEQITGDLAQAMNLINNPPKEKEDKQKAINTMKSVISGLHKWARENLDSSINS